MRSLLTKMQFLSSLRRAGEKRKKERKNSCSWSYLLGEKNPWRRLRVVFSGRTTEWSTTSAYTPSERSAVVKWLDWASAREWLRVNAACSCIDTAWVGRGAEAKAADADCTLRRLAAFSSFLSTLLLFPFSSFNLNPCSNRCRANNRFINGKRK
jgi:hypothetical protein